MAPNPRKKRGKLTRTRTTHSILDELAEGLEFMGFDYYTNQEFRRLEREPEFYAIRGYPHDSLYGTKGSKEGFLVLPKPSGENRLIVSSDNKVRAIVEAKFQDHSGSVDEKLPYVWHNFLVSPIPNWITVFEGHFWQEDRGVAALDWLEAQEPPAGRAFIVLRNRRAWRDFLISRWRVKNGQH